jgi:hypothetical protein
VAQHRYEVTLGGPRGQISALLGRASPLWTSTDRRGGATLRTETEVTQDQLFVIISMAHEMGLSLVGVRTLD